MRALAPPSGNVAAQLADLHRRVEALEAQLARRRSTRDGEDRRILAALSAAAGTRVFSSREVLRHAQSDDRLAAALREADISNARELGKALRRLEQGGAVLRVGADRGGIVWALREVR
jgi:hypothetical protein